MSFRAFCAQVYNSGSFGYLSRHAISALHLHYWKKKTLHERQLKQLEIYPSFQEDTTVALARIHRVGRKQTDPNHENNPPKEQLTKTLDKKGIGVM